uniref:Uncharacterized protein n=1 Tax=Rhizophora mucronata TaxID=61149 RepID=A0A2P2Q4U3_RHIMU
MASFLLFF